MKNRSGLPGVSPLDVMVSRRGVLPAPASVLATEAAQHQQVSLTPWWVERPPFAQDFFATDKNTTLPAAVGSVALPNATFQVPPGDFIAVIKAVTIFINAPTVATDVDWSILINDGPVQGWDHLTTFPRAAANLSIDFGGTIFVPQGALVSMRVNNISGAGPWTVGGSFTGWFLSQTDIARVFGRAGY